MNIIKDTDISNNKCYTSSPIIGPGCYTIGSTQLQYFKK